MMGGGAESCLMKPGGLKGGACSQATLSAYSRMLPTKTYTHNTLSSLLVHSLVYVDVC